ncbi:MAG: AIR synthase related protein, partial [Candidatus Limnocylindrales bacterium]
VGLVDPYLGAALAVAECTRNVAITGARPLGVTDCLNYGDPARPEAFWAFTEGIRGVADACRALDVPVTGGNVSFYNESPLGAIAPTAQIGVVGLLDDVTRRVGPAFRAPGDVVGLLGHTTGGLAGSVYASLAGHDPDDRPPALDFDRERALQAVIIEAAQRGLLASAQDVSGGGLAVAVAEGCIWSGLGADLALPVGSTPALELFGEAPSRIVVTAAPDAWSALADLAERHGLPLEPMGTVGGERLHIRLIGLAATGAAEERGAGVADDVDELVSALAHAWTSGLPRALGEEG